MSEQSLLYMSIFIVVPVEERRRSHVRVRFSHY